MRRVAVLSTFLLLTIVILLVNDDLDSYFEKTSKNSKQFFQNDFFQTSVSFIGSAG